MHYCCYITNKVLEERKGKGERTFDLMAVGRAGAPLAEDTSAMIRNDSSGINGLPLRRGALPVSTAPCCLHWLLVEWNKGEYTFFCKHMLSLLLLAATSSLHMIGPGKKKQKKQNLDFIFNALYSFVNISFIRDEILPPPLCREIHYRRGCLMWFTVRSIQDKNNIVVVGLLENKMLMGAVTNQEKHWSL